jgi:hypothetical protein
LDASRDADCQIARRDAMLPLAVLLALPSAATAQSAEEILMTSLEEYEQRMDGIENYTIVQETMGFETELTFVRTEVEGRTVFVPKGQDDASGGISDFYRIYPEIAERAETASAASSWRSTISAAWISIKRWGARALSYPRRGCSTWTPTIISSGRCRWKARSRGMARHLP